MPTSYRTGRHSKPTAPSRGKTHPRGARRPRDDRRTPRPSRSGSLTAAAFAIGLSLAGCNTPAERPAEPNVNLAGFPPSFKEGYLDGCASARSGAGKKKDDQRFRSDASYAQGWRDGYDVCGRN